MTAVSVLATLFLMNEPQAAHAHIFQLNVSQGGVPKRPLAQAQLNWLGLIGDSQQDTRHHGGLQRALCLYSLEHILALQDEGHPIFPGSVGENITITGLDWAKITPGTRLCLGTEVEIEITAYATPCKTISASFSGGQFNRIHQQLHPGWARAYARVLSGGRLRVGDAVILHE